MYYNYCPECGTESQPFVREPKDGTKITCSYCGTVYPYKTRHWRQQRIFIRAVLTLGVLWFCIHGCVSSCVGDRHEERNTVTATPVRTDSKRTTASQATSGGSKRSSEKIRLMKADIDVATGFAPGYKWGSGKWVGAKRMKRKLEGDSGWDEVELEYGPNGQGLVSFSLIKRGLLVNDCSFLDPMIDPWRKSAGKKQTKHFVKGVDSAFVYLPLNQYGMIVNINVKTSEKFEANLSIVNMEKADIPCDEMTLVRRMGYDEF